jgi:hypothetical protein
MKGRKGLKTRRHRGGAGFSFFKKSPMSGPGPAAMASNTKNKTNKITGTGQFKTYASNVIPGANKYETLEQYKIRMRAMKK